MHLATYHHQHQADHISRQMWKPFHTFGSQLFGFAVLMLFDFLKSFQNAPFCTITCKDFDKISGKTRFQACQLENSLKIGERKNLVLIMMWLFFAKKIILCKKKIILCKKRLFFAKEDYSWKKDYSLQKRKLFFAKKKILCKRNRFGPDAPLKMGFDLEFIRFMFFTCLSFVCLSQFTNKQTFVVCLYFWDKCNKYLSLVSAFAQYSGCVVLSTENYDRIE